MSQRTGYFWIALLLLGIWIDGAGASTSSKPTVATIPLPASREIYPIAASYRADIQERIENTPRLLNMTTTAAENAAAFSPRESVFQQDTAPPTFTENDHCYLLMSLQR